MSGTKQDEKQCAELFCNSTTREHGVRDSLNTGQQALAKLFTEMQKSGLVWQQGARVAIQHRSVDVSLLSLISC